MHPQRKSLLQQVPHHRIDVSRLARPGRGVDLITLIPGPLRRFNDAPLRNLMGEGDRLDDAEGAAEARGLSDSLDKYYYMIVDQ